jgi:hypothetical protein
LENPDHWHGRLLRARRERPCHRRAAERGQEFSSSNVACHVTLRLGVIHATGNDTTLTPSGTGNALANRWRGVVDFFKTKPPSGRDRASILQPIPNFGTFYDGRHSSFYDPIPYDGQVVN